MKQEFLHIMEILLNVTMHCRSNCDAEIYYQDRLEDLSEFDVSELKETVINDIPVKYFTYVEKTDGDRNKFLNCMIDFPDSGYASRVVIFDMFLTREENVMLEGLENLLVDIEIQLAGRTIHKYHFVDKETGDVFISKGVIELASDVVFTFDYNHMKYDESSLEEVFEALRFVVEE